MKKYEMTSNTKELKGRKLFQIRALKDFGDVKVGDLGGYIEKEENLSHGGNAWVYDDALVYGDACVSDNAQVRGDARVYDNAQVYDNAWIRGDARVCGDARVYSNAQVYCEAWVYGDARVCGAARVCGDARVYGDACIYNNAWIYDNARVYGDTIIYGDTCICDDAWICGDSDYICFKGFGSENRNTIMFKTKNGDIYVCCGCFRGSLKEFEEKVKETHGNTKYAKEYLVCIEAAKIHFEIDD
jgi:carbonic anhydrase/acetyltransferase-like protein (isoleucine patch superfamily)